MILVVLAVVWVVALTPWALRKLSERQITSSVASYRRQLLKLGSHAERPDRGSLSVPGAAIGFSAAAQRVHTDGYGRTEVGFDAGVRPGYTDPEPAVANVAVTSRSTAARRRRVIVSLLGATFFFFVLGLIPAARVMWNLALTCLLLAAAYTAAVVYFHRRAVERAQKVVALETRRSVVSALDRARSSGAGGTHVTPRGRVGGAGWSVTESRERELLASSR